MGEEGERGQEKKRMGVDRATEERKIRKEKVDNTQYNKNGM